MHEGKKLYENDYYFFIWGLYTRSVSEKKINKRQDQTVHRSEEIDKQGKRGKRQTNSR